MIQSTFNTSPPDLCSFFWLGVASYLMIPLGYLIQAPILLYNFISTPRNWSYEYNAPLQEVPWWARIGLTIIGWGLTIIILIGGFEFPLTVLSTFLLSPIVIGSIVGIVAGVFWIGSMIVDWFRDRDINLGIGEVVGDAIENTCDYIGNSWFVQGIISFKEKHCKRINYK